MSIRESVKSAFNTVPYPGDDNITRCTWKDCPECDDIAMHFRGTSWHDRTVAELQQYQSALTFFTPQALQYFLPAYMLVSLEAWHEADDIPFSILCICLPSDPSTDARLQQYERERFEIFTAPQRQAIAAYLREWAVSDVPLVEVYADDIPRAIDRLLDHEPAPNKSP